MIPRELAGLIRQGLLAENVQESDRCFLEPVLEKFHVCALGAGLVGKFGSPNKAWKIAELQKQILEELEEKSPSLDLTANYIHISSELLEIELSLAQAIDRSHLNGITALVICRRLEQGRFQY